MRALTLLSLATLLTSAVLCAQTANPARPGTLNYVEGQVSVDGQTIKPSSVGSTTLETGQVLETGTGKAEMLLTPGVFLRLGDNTAVKLISPDLIRTEVQIERGSADVEVDQIFKQNHLLVDDRGDQAQLLKTGFYAFDSTDGVLRVFDGKAAVLPQDADQSDRKPETVKSGHELALNGDLVKPEHFDKKDSQDTLYDWSSLRSNYLGESNLEMASSFAGEGGFAPGWFWNGGLGSYTFLPGEGAFFNPFFGSGFYSPEYLYGGGSLYGFGGFGYPGYGYGYGYPIGGYHGRLEGVGRGGVRGGIPVGVVHPGVGGGYHGGGVAGGGFAGGGFHGGGAAGGFHGGGGGGYHGGGGHR